MVDRLEQALELFAWLTRTTETHIWDGSRTTFGLRSPGFIPIHWKYLDVFALRKPEDAR